MKAWEREFQHLKLTSWNESLLAFLIESQSDFEDFMENFWEGKNNQFFSVMKYRRYKMEQNGFGSCEEFIQSYEQNPFEALERLFMHPISETDLILLNEMQKKKSITLSELFAWHRDNPELLLPRILR